MTHDSRATEPASLTCKSCGHQWTGATAVGVSVAAWVTFLEAQPCPECGAGYAVAQVRDEATTEASA